MKKLLKFTKLEAVDLCITRFNYHEILKKYKDEIRPHIKKIKGTKSDLLRLQASEIIDVNNLKVETFVEKYKTFLDELIEANDIKIIDFPESRDVVGNVSYKYFNNIKPFDENKVSFQDAIIWESIVEYYNKSMDGNIAFISNNHKDFANKEKNGIHEDLIQDIEDITYHESLVAFLEREEDNLKDYINENFEYDEEVLRDKIDFFFEKNDLLQDTIDDMLINSEFSGDFLEGWGTDGYIEKCNINLNEFSLDIEENAILISFDIELDVSFSIETVDPTFERGDDGDGMISETSSTSILIQSNITYSLDNEEFIDYVELDREFI